MTRYERIEKITKSKVFLSHHKIDREVAKQIAVFLTSESISVWFDEWETNAGDSITDEIENGLKTCTHFIVLWSKYTSRSNWIREELKFALGEGIKKKSIKVIPILLDDTEKPSLLKERKHIEYHGGSEKDWEEIIEAITGNKPQTSFAHTIEKMYNEIIFGKKIIPPFNVKFCPNCGSNKIDISTSKNYTRDAENYTIVCKICNWVESGEL